MPPAAKTETAPVRTIQQKPLGLCIQQRIAVGRGQQQQNHLTGLKPATTYSYRAANTAAYADDTIKVGVTGGPHAELMDVVKGVAAKNGLNIKIIEFADYVQPNAALASGDLDANSYQHDPYLEAQVKDRGYKLIRVADTVTFQMGIYSKKIKSLAELQLGQIERACSSRKVAKSSPPLTNPAAAHSWSTPAWMSRQPLWRARSSHSLRQSTSTPLSSTLRAAAPR